MANILGEIYFYRMAELLGKPLPSDEAILEHCIQRVAREIAQEKKMEDMRKIIAEAQAQQQGEA